VIAKATAAFEQGDETLAINLLDGFAPAALVADRRDELISERRGRHFEPGYVSEHPADQIHRERDARHGGDIDAKPVVELVRQAQIAWRGGQRLEDRLRRIGHARTELRDDNVADLGAQGSLCDGVPNVHVRCPPTLFESRDEEKLCLRRAGSQQIVFIAGREFQIERAGEPALSR
jgi:hypothetical protein